VTYYFLQILVVSHYLTMHGHWLPAFHVSFSLGGSLSILRDSDLLVSRTSHTAVSRISHSASSSCSRK
jgi:hypothetical protein